MNDQTAFLIIDAQRDFCHPHGALFVPGAVEDMQRLSALIQRNLNAIDHICLTLDTHPVNDISHPSFWEDARGNHPAPFTQITAQDVVDGTWTPRFDAEKVRRYLENLEAQRQFLHFIWPEHCLAGSTGAALDDSILKAVHAWATRTGKNYQTVIKGTHPLTEHFGVFQAQIPIAGQPETQLNTFLLQSLSRYETVYVAGEAKSHCVATSIRQVLDHAPELAAKMVIMEDCMSDVTGLGHLGEPIYAAARERGMHFAKSADIVLK